MENSEEKMLERLLKVDEDYYSSFGEKRIDQIDALCMSTGNQQLRRFVDGKFYKVPLLNRYTLLKKVIIYFLFDGNGMFVGELNGFSWQSDL